MTDYTTSLELGTILPYVHEYYEPNPPKYQVVYGNKKHRYWVYAHTMEEAKKFSAEAKAQEFI